VLQQPRRARQQRVGGVHHGLQFARRVAGRQRREVVFIAFAQRLAERPHRPRGALHHGHHHHGDQRHQQRLLSQRLQQQRARQRAAQLQRLGHLHRGHALAGRPGHGLQQHGHAHRLAPVFVVVEAHERGVGVGLVAAGTRRRQVLETRDDLAAEARDLVEEPASVVGLEGLERAVFQRRLQAWCAAVAADFQPLADGLGAGQQRAVVGGVGGLQRLRVQARGVQHDEAQHRQQDAHQQLAAQRVRPQREPTQ